MSEQPSKKQPPVKKIVLIVILIIAGYFGYKKISYNLNHETTDNAQIETQIIPILPRISGYVKNLSVADYDSVHTDQFLIELDDAELQSQLAEMQADSIQAEADILNARATLQNAITSISINKGNSELSKIKLSQTQTEFRRNQQLFADQAITQKQLDDAKYNVEIAEKNYNNSGEDVKTAQSKIPVLEAMVKKSEAALKVKASKINEIRLKLSYTKIFAPATGRIGKKNITTGQFVQMGTPLFSIVNDSIYWVTANFKENQIKNLFVGKQVELRVDALPDEKITGTIESISEATGAKFALLPPDNSSGNFVKVSQRVPVKIKINNLDKIKPQLRAGLSVFVTAEIK